MINKKQTCLPTCLPPGRTGRKLKTYFIGIGGVGVSGLANIFLEKGYFVLGSDKEKSEITELLEKKGAKVFISHKAKNLPHNTDLVVYSEAVPESNPELKKAKRLGIKTRSGAEAIADFAKNYFLIAVSGMHGKTTTASMAAKTLLDAGLDPTYIIGAKNGYRLGKSKYFLIEADDYKAKFLNYRPDILILTNIEEEHLDCLKNITYILDIFKQYVGQVKKTIIANRDDENVFKTIFNFQFSIFKPKVIFYSLKDRGAGDLRGKMNVAGEHNVSNALAVLKLAQALKIPQNKAIKSLLSYEGAWRRLEEKQLKIKNQKFKIISDYAHHPTEIKATVQAIKEKYPKENILLIFQPHQYQRTYYLFDRFVKCFQEISPQIKQIIITDIYTVKGRESAALKKKVSAQKLVKTIKKENIVYLPEKQLLPFIKKNIHEFKVVTIMTAGNIYKLFNSL